jgi:hypothetical protein
MPQVAVRRRALAGAVVSLLLFSAERGAYAAEPSEVCAVAAERAQPLKRAGQLVRARVELLQCARDACPAVVRADCARWLTDVDGAIPSIVVRALTPAGEDAVAVRVSADGRTVAERLDGKPIALDPGEHTLRYELAGAAPIEARVVLAQGERDRVLRVQFAAPGTVTPSTPATPPAAPQKTGTPAWTWVLGGVGVAAVGTGVAFYGIGLGQRSTLADSCAPQHACDDGRISAARTKLVIGDVLVGVGAVALAASIYFALTGRAATTTTAGAAPLVRF